MRLTTISNNEAYYPFSIFKDYISTDVNSLFKLNVSKKESASRLPIQNSESCSTISSAKANESFTVYSLVKDFKIGTKNFANF